MPTVGRSVLSWPDAPGSSRPRLRDHEGRLDGLVAGRAEKAGAVLWQGAEAVAPLCGPPGLAGGAAAGGPGAVVKDGPGVPRPRSAPSYVIVADGSLSRFGRALGTARRPRMAAGHGPSGLLPLAPAHRVLHRLVPRHPRRRRQGRARLRLDLPLGDGRVNVGVGLLSTKGRWKQREHDQAHGRLRRPGTRLVVPRRRDLLRCTDRRAPPDGPRRRPAVGPNWIAVGDAAGAINPFNGEGIAYAYETGAPSCRGRLGRPRGRRPPPPRVLRRVPAGHLRALLPGRPCLHRRAVTPWLDAPLRQHRHVQPVDHGMALRIMGTTYGPTSSDRRRRSTGPSSRLASQMPER